MYIFIKNSYSSLQYLAKSILWMELLNLLKLLKSVDAGSSFQTLTIHLVILFEYTRKVQIYNV